MADGPYRFQQPGTGPYYYQQQHNQQSHHQRHLVRNGSPVNNGRSGYHNETPSPSRSPVSQNSSHNPFSMYNQGHQQGQHAMMNGAAGHQRFMQMNLPHKYQQQPHQSHHAQQNHHAHTQNHSGHPGMGHQHTFSSGTMTNSTPTFTPAGLQNGTTSNNQAGMGEPISEHWQLQLQLAAESRNSAATPHHHCRRDGVSRVNKTSAPTSTEESQKDGELVERYRATNSEVQRQDWDAMDLSGQGLRAISQDLFANYMFLDKLFIDNNKLSSLPPALGKLRNLRLLNASNNELMQIPEEIGMLVNLRELLLFDNNLHDLPYEVGHLYQLETLGVEGNPLDEDLKAVIMQSGTKALVVQLRDSIQAGTPPEERDWLILDETSAGEKFSVLDYNILCQKAATVAQYGYTPSEALSWDYRKEVILEEIKMHDADIVCLQEVDVENYNEFFRKELAYNDYRSVYWPKARARMLTEREAKNVDGCATFYKSSKYILLDKQMIDFANTAITRPDMKGEHDIFNRVMPRDHIAVVCFFENRMTGSRMIVVNTHIYWDPAYTDVKLVQVAIMLEQTAKFADRWATHPPCTDKAIFRHGEPDSDASPDSPDESPKPSPSIEYSTGSQIPLIICGDFNSTAGTGVHDLLSHGTLPNNHPDLAGRGYGNFTRDGMAHPFSLNSAYNDELRFTNYTPGYDGVIEYIWYSTGSLQVIGLLGEVDEKYLQKVPGFPYYHFPSDHLALRTEFAVKPRKERKVVEADFGTFTGAQRERRP